MMDLKSRQFLNIFLAEKLFNKCRKVRDNFYFTLEKNNLEYLYHCHDTCTYFEEQYFSDCEICGEKLSKGKDGYVEFITPVSIKRGGTRKGPIGAPPVWHVLCFPLWKIKR